MICIDRIDRIDDVRLEPYRQLKARELARHGGRFIAEGEHVVKRLLASRFQTESVLLAERRVQAMAPLVPEGVPVYVAGDAMIRELIGYKFHAGALACAFRGPRRSIDDVLPPRSEERSRPMTLVICPDLANVANVGGMIRIAAGFGCDAMILGEHSHDPFFRQSVRVSMGTIFQLPIAQSENLLADLDRLRKEWGVQLAAAVLDESAEPLEGAARPDRFALLFGNEAQGLDATTLAACDRKITIPMRLGTDSLNVMVAAGIFLYHFTRGAAVSGP